MINKQVEILGKSVVKIYGDGEFWIDGTKRAKLYPDGEIWADGHIVARLYEDGDIWSGGVKIGHVYSDGELWIGNNRVATGIYLLDLLDHAPNQARNERGFDYRGNRSAPNFENYKSKSSNGSSVGGCFIFVAVLLLIAFIYGCFRFWISELPGLLFGNMQTLGNVAMIFVYAGMFLMMYLHICMATQKKAVLFLRGILLQAGAFFVNIIVFTILDLIITALSYGFTIADALGEIGGALGGGIFGFLVIGIFVGLAPTIVSAFVSFLCIKKGTVLSVPNGIQFKPSSTSRRTTSYGYSTFSAQKSRSHVTYRGSKKFVPSKATKFSDWDAERIMKAFCCLIFLALLVFMSASIPLSLTGLDMEEMDSGMYAVCAVAVIAGIIIRRKFQENMRKPFLFGWLVQSVMQIIACLVNWSKLFGSYSLMYISDYIVSLCGMCFIVGLFFAVFTNVFVAE